MQNVRLSRCYSVLLSCMLFGAPLIVSQDDTSPQVASQNQNVFYICFDKGISNISDVVYEIAALDANENSPIHLLREHLENGYLLGLQDEVIQVLEYANWFVDQLPNTDAKRTVTQKLDTVIAQVLSGSLSMDEETAIRSHLRLLTIDERIRVIGKAIFKNNVIIDKKLRVHGRARFYKNVHFKEDVKIDDDLRVGDDLTVGDDLSVGDNAVISGDLTVGGTLSVNDIVITGCIGELCVDSLSVTEGFIEFLSVADGTITGTLSAADEVVGCDLTVGCNINMNNSTSAAVGNINKGGSRFLHNFGTNDTFVGTDAGNFTTTGSNNVGVGFSALTAITTGIDNTAVGSVSLASNTAGSANTALGRSALNANTVGVDNVAVGRNALLVNTIGIENVAVGTLALEANTTGNANVGVGKLALANNTTGIENVAVGKSALLNNTIGVGNTAVGTGTLQANTTGSDLSAFGFNALNANTIGIGNSAFGAFALAANTTGIDNTAVGNATLTSNTIGTGNTAVGRSALNANTTGADNVAVGRDALVVNTTGIQNVAVGALALKNILNGVNNVAVGVNAGSATLASTDSNNIFIGTNAGASIFGSNQNIMIGHAGALADASTIRIGTPGLQLKTFIAGIRGVVTTVADAIPVLIDSAGQLGTASSSRQFKHDIKQMTDESAAILALNPVSFIYNADASQTRQFGLIAEEVDEVFPRLVIRDKDGSPYTVRYEVLPVLLLNEMKKLVNRVETMDEALEILKAKFAEFSSRR